MNKVKCLLQTKWKEKELNTAELKSLLDEYHHFIKTNNYIINKEISCLDTLMHLKRDSCKIGPWENISPFEAANRIASDLVIINGLIQMVNTNVISQNSVFKLRLGTMYESNKGDFSINNADGVTEGEAFNVAPSFYKAKLNSTLTKWKKIKINKKNQLDFILVNNEVVFEEDITRLKIEGIQLIGVVNWNKIK
jgi:hypothetical protein